MDAAGDNLTEEQTDAIESEVAEAVKAATLAAERDQAAQLLTYTVGCMWLLCCGVEENVHLFLENNGMDLATDILKNGIESTRLTLAVNVTLGSFPLTR